MKGKLKKCMYIDCIPWCWTQYPSHLSLSFSLSFTLPSYSTQSVCFCLLLHVVPIGGVGCGSTHPVCFGVALVLGRSGCWGHLCERRLQLKRKRNTVSENAAAARQQTVGLTDNSSNGVRDALRPPHGGIGPSPAQPSPNKPIPAQPK